MTQETDTTIVPSTAQEFIAETRSFWIAHGPSLHFGELALGERLSTGQAQLEIFARRLPWRMRVIALGGNPDAAPPG